jgi:hypothetical protein
MQWWQQPFFEVALPIMVTIILGTWYQCKPIKEVRDDISKQIDTCIRGEKRS